MSAILKLIAEARDNMHPDRHEVADAAEAENAERNVATMEARAAFDAVLVESVARERMLSNLSRQNHERDQRDHRLCKALADYRSVRPEAADPRELVEAVKRWAGIQ